MLCDILTIRWKIEAIVIGTTLCQEGKWPVKNGDCSIFWLQTFQNPVTFFFFLTMVKMIALIILLLILLIYQHACSQSPAVFASFPLCANLHVNSALSKPKQPLRPDSVQGCKSKQLIWHPNVCLSFAADAWPIDAQFWEIFNSF